MVELVRAAGTKFVRFPNTIAHAGDSRSAAQFLDLPQLNKSNAGWMNWAAAYLRQQGKPLITLGNFATSGFRDDEKGPGLDSAIATGAAMVCNDGPINSIAGVRPATFTGSIDASGVLAVSALTNTIGLGGVVTGGTTVANTNILSQLTGTKGSTGTYQTDKLTVVASASLTSTGYVSRPGCASAGVYVTSANLVSCMFANMKEFVKRINDKGSIAVLDWEMGGTGFTPTEIGYLNDYSRLLSDFLQNGDGDGRGVPMSIVLDQSAQILSTFSNGSIAFKTNVSVDGVHLAVTGAQLRGSAAAGILSPYLKIVPGHRLRSLNQGKSGQGTRSLIQTAGFPGTAAATGTGNSGNLPTNVIAGNSAGGVTNVFSIQATSADADGNTWGNEVKVVVTASASGTGNVAIVLDKTLVAIGDFIRGVVEVDATGVSGGYQGVSADIEWFPSTGGTSPTYDMAISGVGLDPGGYTNLPLEPNALFIPTFTGTPFMNIALRWSFNAAGAVTIIFRKADAERATA